MRCLPVRKQLVYVVPDSHTHKKTIKFDWFLLRERESRAGGRRKRPVCAPVTV